MLERARTRTCAVRQPLPHDSAHLHVSGEAQYVDDLAQPHDLLHIAVGLSEHACARVVSADYREVLGASGVVDVLHAGCVPGVNDCSPSLGDDPVFADGTVQFLGQVIFAVVAETEAQARDACKLARIEYEPQEPVLTIEAAMDRQSLVLDTARLTRGDAEGALQAAPHRISGSVRAGGQDHFYLEGQVSMVVPREAGDLLVYSSTQHPSEVQHLVASVTGKALHSVTVEVRRMGGAFGGKESQASQWACIAAVAALRTGRAAKLRLDRDTDMIATGKRHDFVFDYEAGFDDAGVIQALKVKMASRCGYSADLSGPINDRALLHIDNCYYLENIAAVSYRCKTNTVSNTAFRGFGAPQAMLCIETVIDRIAAHRGKDPLRVRRVNFYGARSRNIAPYSMKVSDFPVRRLVRELHASARYDERRRQIREWNAASEVIRRGIAMTPVKFGISFTMTHYNQASALVHVYTDGSIHLNHGGTEMGQGLFVKVAQVVAEEFSVPLESIKMAETNTSRVPNTSATAASSGSDINGMAVRDAVRKIRRRLAAAAAHACDVPAAEVVFSDGQVFAGSKVLSFAELARIAHRQRVPLSATGYYGTPKIHWDRKAMSGRPFYYFGCGAAVSEVAVDCLTGETRLLQVDILHDVGRSLNPAIDQGQIEGGFVQGFGWLTSEELWWDERGSLATHAPSTYKIPTSIDVPARWNVHIWKHGRNIEPTIYRSKAVGEPPLMLGISVFSAIGDAICSVADYRDWPQLDAPATPERVLSAIRALQAGRR